MTFRMKWLGSEKNTYAINQYGVELRVKFLPGTKMWGVYRDGVLREKRETRNMAKTTAKRWFGWDRPSDQVRCPTCMGSGMVKRAVAHSA